MVVVGGLSRRVGLASPFCSACCVPLRVWVTVLYSLVVLLASWLQDRQAVARDSFARRGRAGALRGDIEQVRAELGWRMYSHRCGCDSCAVV